MNEKKKIKLKFMENKELKFSFDDENSFKVIFICFLYNILFIESCILVWIDKLEK